MADVATLHGGLRLDTHTARSTTKPISTAPAPTEAVLPLDQHAGHAARPVVRVGERVRRGQPIAESQHRISAWLHAPVAGSVRAIELRPAPHHAGGNTLSIVIDNDGSDEQQTHELMRDYTTLAPSELCEHIGRGGIVGLGGAVFPTAAKLAASGGHEAMHLLLNGAECEPWLSCDDMLMRERAGSVLRGAQILCHVLQAQHCTVAIEDDMPDAAHALRSALEALRDDRIQVVLVPRLYPAGGERQLIATITGREVPAGGLPMDIGVICQNVATAAAVAHWVCDGVPLISRIVTITGSAVAAPANLEARLGTAIAQLIEACGGYRLEVEHLIMGGSMMGSSLPSDALPVVKSTNCIVAAAAGDLPPRGPEMPCIRCGSCSRVCPAILLPQQLHWFAQRPGGTADLAALTDLGLMDCIECGCCDYVCPSQIPLTRRFRENKALLAPVLASRAQAAQSRQRFEDRTARLQRLEQEQRARLEAKRRALRGSD
jgi:Na+-translocating ferredoxin:NAD+ oxidoreductase subunit C